jgi:predicted ATPase
VTNRDFVVRLRLRNYKSVAACDIQLEPLTFLVGPNGSGKSNLLDSLRFVAEALRTSLEHALRDRGGIKEVRRRSGGHPTHFGIRLDLRLPGGESAYYAFRIGARQRGGYEVQTEECAVIPAGAHEPAERYVVRSGEVVDATAEGMPPAQDDRLYLVTASSLRPFRKVFDRLSRMGFYNLNPAQIRELQPPDSGDVLARDGANLAHVLRQISKRSDKTKQTIEEFLAEVVPGVRGADARAIGPRETVEFRQDVTGSKDPWRFYGASMSDGTLRVLGILVALFQSMDSDDVTVPLVGIEEPETALHPAATGLLLDALLAASARTQVAVTSHSPDLLDDKRIPLGSIVAVLADGGETRAAPVDAAGRKALSEHLYTAGELLRMNQLIPDSEHVQEVREHQLKLFGADA